MSIIESDNRLTLRLMQPSQAVDQSCLRTPGILLGVESTHQLLQQPRRLQRLLRLNATQEPIGRQSGFELLQQGGFAHPRRSGYQRHP